MPDGENTPAIALREAFIALDESRVTALLETVVSAQGVEAMVIEFVVPVIWDLERMWTQEGRFSVLHERHVASLLRKTMKTYAPLSSSPPLSPFVLACPPGETHDIRQMLFAVLLQQRGVATLTLGANVPWGMLAHTLRESRARGCALYVSHPRVVVGKHRLVQHLGSQTPLFIAGPATHLTHVTGVPSLPPTWRAAVDLVTTTIRPPEPPTSQKRAPTT